MWNPFVAIPAWAPAVACGLAALALPARADVADVFNVTVAESLTRDDNLFRLSDGTVPPAGDAASRADSLSRTTLRLSADRAVSRQHLSAGAGMSLLRYRRNADLDRELRDWNAAWRWRAGSRWSGDLESRREETIPAFSEFRATLPDRTTNRSNRFGAGWQLHPDWQVRLAARRSETRHDAPVNALADTIVESRDLGLHYERVPGNSIGLSLLRADARYPNRQAVGPLLVVNDYRETGADLAASWQPSGASRLRGTLGRRDRRHAEVASRDFSGRVASLAWDFAPTGRTALGASLRRDLGTEGDLDPSYALTRTAQLSLGWNPTARLALSLAFERRERDRLGDPAAALAGLPVREDHDRSASVGVSWTAIAGLVVSLDRRTERRESNLAAFAYRARQTSLSLRYLF
jgi:exopolysaccharide biosynthesis operon protein EpsL